MSGSVWALKKEVVMIEEFQPSSGSIPTIKLWTPNTISALTFFTGFPSGILLASINWFKMRMRGRAIAHILGGIIGILIFLLLPEGYDRGFALLANLGFLAYIGKKMKGDMEGINGYNIQNAHWLSGLLIVLLGWGMVIAGGMIVIFLKPFIPGTSSYYYAKGNELANRGDFENAIVNFNKAIALNPEDSYFYTNRGFAFAELGDLASALADFNKAIELNPEDYIAYNNRGHVYYSTRDYDRAIADYTKAIYINPDNALSYNNRGLAYRDKGDYGNAISDFTSVIRIYPNASEAYFDRAYVYMLINDFNGAIPNYDRIIRLEPNNALAYYFRGIAYEGLGQINNAEKDFEKALELAADPNLKQEIANRLQNLKGQ